MFMVLLGTSGFGAVGLYRAHGFSDWLGSCCDHFNAPFRQMLTSFYRTASHRGFPKLWVLFWGSP